jgi:hypothetical protein
MTESDKQIFRRLAHRLLASTDDPMSDARTCAEQCVSIGRLVLADLKTDVPATPINPIQFGTVDRIQIRDLELTR